MSSVVPPPGHSETDVAVVEAAARLRGELRMPGDKSISHRALMLATLARGESRIQESGDGADVRPPAAFCRPRGAPVDRLGGDDLGSTVAYRVVSPGIDGLSEAATELDCG